VFSEVPDSLALVWLRLAVGADDSGHLAHRLLVDPGHDDSRGFRDVEGDALGGLYVDRVAESQLQLKCVGALGHGPVTDTDDLEFTAEPL
jgi:hypothetical protein